MTASQRAGGDGDGALRAMIAGLKQRVGSPGTT
jgi:hypothetical protein